MADPVQGSKVNQGTPGASPWPVSGTVTAGATRGTFTDRSGTLTLAGTSQRIAAANLTRNVFHLQNTGTARLWFNFTTPATTASPSFFLDPGAGFSMPDQEGFVSTEAINVNGATTGQAWTAKEG